jgi:hypothetical protein
MYDQYGRAIARDTGNETVRLLVDNAGTPTDPSDDTVVEFLGEVMPRACCLLAASCGLAAASRQVAEATLAPGRWLDLRR